MPCYELKLCNRLKAIAAVKDSSAVRDRIVRPFGAGGTRQVITFITYCTLCLNSDVYIKTSCLCYTGG